MRSLKKEYGDKKGEQVYYAMENKAGGNKTALLRSLHKKK